MNLSIPFRPKVLDTLKGYRREGLWADVLAGVTVGIVALPLAIALSIASGLRPESGVYTAVIGGLLISLLGGSRVQIGGPAGAFVPLLLPIFLTHGAAGLAGCALIAGLILFTLGATRMGGLIKYIPFPVVTGFTSGIALLILSTQIGDFLGLERALPGDFLQKIRALAGGFHPNWPTVLLGSIAAVLIWFWPAKLGRRVPGTIVVLVLAALVSKFAALPARCGIATLGTVFGGLPQNLPVPHWPALTFDQWRALLPAAMTVAVLGAIESLLCAVVADGMIDDRHDSNQELMAQGIANLASGFFGGMPVTGVLARTATNVRHGGRTPVAGMIHALTLLVLLLVAAPLLKHVPLAALSAVLVVVAVRMGEWHQFTRMRRWPKSDAAVFLCAFVLTVVTELPTAVGASLVLASAFLVKRLSDIAEVQVEGDVSQANAAGQQTKGRVIPEGVLVYRVSGALFFCAADKLETVLRRAGELPEVLILRVRDVLAIDATGLEALEDLMEKLRRQKKDLILCGPHSQPMFALTRAGLVERLGLDNVCADLDHSLERARLLGELKKTDPVSPE
jgi:SulP family sulfate permease